MHRDKNEDNLTKYKQVCKESKKVIREAKLKAHEDFYTRLDSRNGENNIYKIAKMREENEGL